MMREVSEIVSEICEAWCSRAKVLFGGRLAEYRYYDMDEVIESAMNAAEKEFEKQVE